MSGRLRFRPLHEREVAEAAQRIQVSLGGTEQVEAVEQRVREYAAESALWVLADPDDRVLGQLVLTAGHHCFGGRRVLCQHVADVLVPPEHRGRGLAKVLMTEALRHGVHEGHGLSLLFPSSAAFYRQLGWELSGTFTRWRAASQEVPLLTPAMRPLHEEWDAIAACQARWAQTLPGAEVRGTRQWEALRTAARFAYGLDAEDGEHLEAYVLAVHRRIDDHWQHTMRILDWAALTPRGLRAVVGFGGHGAMARDVELLGPTPHPWSLLLPGQGLERIHDFHWMARPLDLGEALRSRGFAKSIQASVRFAVDDHALEANAGPWRLDVEDGRAAVALVPKAEVSLAVNAVGPMFTGYRSASDLARAGLVSGPSDAVDRLDGIFAGGPLPTLLDAF